MALRDENHFFTRRIADGGSDKIVFKSQDRKIQETDPKDVIWDEIIEKKEHPEDGNSYKFQETDSEFFIRDENYGKEEYLGSCSTIYPSPPCFDNYGDEKVSIEDFWWVAKALNMVVVQEGRTDEREITGESPEYANVSTRILSNFMMAEKTDIGGIDHKVAVVAEGNVLVSKNYLVEGLEAVEDGSFTMPMTGDNGSSTVLTSCWAASIVDPSIMPRKSKSLIVGPDLSGCQTGDDFSILAKQTCIEEIRKRVNIQMKEDILFFGGEDILAKMDVGWELISIVLCKDLCEHEILTRGLTINSWHENLIQSSSFDGGIIEKQVELFKQFIIFMSMIRSDIPYEPGGCSSNMCFKHAAKLLDEFF